MSEENLEGLDTPETLDALDAPETTEESTSEPVKAHPAHEKILAELPEAWHQKVLPHLQEQDKYFQQQIEKYTPYKQFLDEGVDPSYIAQSMQLAQAIAADPITVHQNLTNALMQQGLLREDAEEAAGEIMEDAELYEEEGLPDSVKRELARRDAELDAIKGHLSEQEFEKATQAELQTIEREFTDLANSYEVTAAQEKAILELMDSAIARGENLSVFQAAKKLVEITGSGFRKRGATGTPAASAPTVLGGSGGNGVPFEGVEVPRDDKSKKEMLAQLFKNNMG
jgi:hypothetical protein